MARKRKSEGPTKDDCKRSEEPNRSDGESSNPNKRLKHGSALQDRSLEFDIAVRTRPLQPAPMRAPAQQASTAMLSSLQLTDGMLESPATAMPPTQHGFGTLTLPFHTKLDQTAVPTSPKTSNSTSRKARCLRQIQAMWGGSLEDELLPSLRQQRPSGMEWDTELVKSLAQLARYGMPEEINSLLLERVRTRTTNLGDSIVRTGDVWAVIEDLTEQSREPREPVDVGYLEEA